MSAVLDQPRTAPRPLTLAEISASIPGARGAKRLHPATITKWIILGSMSRNGVRVRLAATRAGGRWLVYQTDLDTFFAALAADPAPAPVAKTNTSTRAKASAAAGKRLEMMGA